MCLCVFNIGFAARDLEMCLCVSVSLILLGLCVFNTMRNVFLSQKGCEMCF